MDPTPKRDAFAVLTGSAKRRKILRPDKDASQPSSFRSCPLCERAIPRALIENHVAACKGKSDYTASPTPAAGNSITPEALSDNHPENKPNVSQQPAAAAGDAFSLLMAEQREQSQVMVFFLEQLPDKTCQTYWWTKGQKTSAGQLADSDTPPRSGSLGQTHAANLPNSKSVWSAATQISSSALQSMTTRGTSLSKSKLTVQLQTNVALGSEADLAQMTSVVAGTFRGSPSLLKSALQKNVRLCRAGPAVRCAMQLMKDNAGEFLRRISIICLEDAILHPGMPVLVWLMCAQAKGYCMGRALASACLRMVYELARMPVRDCYPAKASMQTTGDAAGSSLSDEEALLVRCVSVRAAYGGMAGDVNMLTAFAATWTARFRSGPSCPHAMPSWNQVNGTDFSVPCQRKTTPGKGSSIGRTWLSYLQQSYASISLPSGEVDAMALMPLKRGDIPLSAIDFHISSIVEELMQKPAISAVAQDVAAQLHQSDPHDCMRRAMWLFRSSSNTKAELCANTKAADTEEKQALQPVWQAARAAADTWSMDYVRRRFT